MLHSDSAQCCKEDFREKIYQASGQPAHDIQIAQGELTRNKTPGKRQSEWNSFTLYDPCLTPQPVPSFDDAGYQMALRVTQCTSEPPATINGGVGVHAVMGKRSLAGS